MSCHSVNINLAQLACHQLKGVGPQLSNYLNQCSIRTVQDLLLYLPLRYENRTCITPLCKARHADCLLIEGVIKEVALLKTRRRSLICRIDDGTGSITMRFFHFTIQQYHSFEREKRLRCFGEIRSWLDHLEMIHPEYQFIDDNAILPTATCLTPIYSTKKGLTQRRLYELTEQALVLLAQSNEYASGYELPDYLPENILTRLKLPKLAFALQYIHRPPPDAPMHLMQESKHPTQQRLIFEELLARYLSLRRLRENIQRYAAPALLKKNKATNALFIALPFQLTTAQQRVLDEIYQDIAKSKPMLRLLQGDVGSGKTIIAALAALRAIENNHQVALMAPTELLAKQHFQNFCIWFKPLGITVVWLAGKKKNKADSLNKIKEDQAQMIIGTHALLQSHVTFARLGLIIIDEQHRFGVHQRLVLREKGMCNKGKFYPHQLIMTATPIPRTLAMTDYADLDISVIDELPPSRLPVKTIVIPDKRRPKLIARIRQACAKGQQIYWVCPFIEECEIKSYQAAKVAIEQLKLALPKLRIGLVHGQLKAQQREETMLLFEQGKIDVLVATTVIEVGIDVCNANWIIIENAERLGLAQLHQLRGRVGRGNEQSYCVLLYQHLSAMAKARLSIMRSTNDGFKIAQHDLALRGAGEVLSTRQSGRLHFRIANLERDQYYLPEVRKVAETILHQYPAIVEPLIQRWINTEEKWGNA